MAFFPGKMFHQWRRQSHSHVLTILVADDHDLSVPQAAMFCPLEPPDQVATTRISETC